MAPELLEEDHRRSTRTDDLIDTSLITTIVKPIKQHYNRHFREIFELRSNTMGDLVLKGDPWNFQKIEIGIGEYFFQKANQIGDKVFQIDAVTGQSETYQEVNIHSVRLAIYLQNLGVKEGDIIVVCCSNNLSNIVPCLAAFYLGATVSSLDPKQTPGDVEHSLEVLEPKLVVVQRESLSLVQKGIQSKGQHPTIIAIGGTSGKYPDMHDIVKCQSIREKTFQPKKVKGSDVALLFFSSGTTSVPKAISVSSFAMLNVPSVLAQHNHGIYDVVLQFSSLYWISAWLLTVSALGAGGIRVIAENISAEQFFKIVDKFRVTTVFASSMMSYRITALNLNADKTYDTSSLFSFSLGGSVLDPEQLINLRNYIPHTHVNLVYGSTEANYISGHNYSNPKLAKEFLASSGTVLPGVEVKIVDLETRRPLGPNEHGEVCVRSPLLMSGYYKFSKPDVYDDNGFLKVGDLGYYDEKGFLYIVDRVAETFKFHYEKIIPSKLETILMTHPAVKEAVVFGLTHYRDRNHPAACISLKPGCKADVQDIVDYVNKQVPDSYKLRGGVGIMDEIPKTPTGKLQRRAAKEWYIGQKSR